MNTVLSLEGNADKLQQVQTIQQQILQFINNPRPEGLNAAKHFREMLEKIPVNLLVSIATKLRTLVF